MTELLLLLLPLAAASGWYAARRSLTSSGGKRASRYPGGLNELLTDHSDHTLETFIDLLHAEGDEVEMHLLLGGLFRRRGEVDRAIRVHQNLIARPALPAAQRSRALLELGEDYMKAGLLDRAENIFSDLVSRQALVEPALRGLVDIYQRENEWESAIGAAQKLQRRDRRDQKRFLRFIAHCYCELAEEANREKDFRRAGEMLARARRSDPQCARIDLIQGSMAYERQEFRGALKGFQAVARADPQLIPEIVHPLLDCYQKLDDETGLLEYLEGLYREHGDQEVLALAVSRLRHEGGDSEEARTLLLDFLRRQPSIGAMTYLTRLGLLNGEGDEALRDALERLRAGLPDYRCTQCGFTGSRLHWQCPGCRNWDTVRPLAAYGCNA